MLSLGSCLHDFIDFRHYHHQHLGIVTPWTLNSILWRLCLPFFHHWKYDPLFLWLETDSTGDFKPRFVWAWPRLTLVTFLADPLCSYIQCIVVDDKHLRGMHRQIKSDQNCLLIAYCWLQPALLLDESPCLLLKSDHINQLIFQILYLLLIVCRTKNINQHQWWVHNSYF